MFPTEATSFSQLFEGNIIWLYVGLSIINAIVIFYSSVKFMLVHQLGGYYYKRYFKWLRNSGTSYKSRLLLLCLLAFLFFCVLSMCFAPILGEKVSSYMGFMAYFVFSIAYIKTESMVNQKIKLKKTKRLVRLCITYVLVLVGISFGLITLLNYLAFVIGDNVVAILRYSVLCLLPIAIPYLLFLAYCINEPFEWLVRTHYTNKARWKLKNSNIIKIGITGSYGKTSVKEILKTILSQKYRVLATPESYNTPMGIARTVNKLDSTHDVFIAEMGARGKGDIKELAEMVKPQYGVLVSINQQHLESFGSEEAIRETKYELVEALPEDGVAFFSSDNSAVLDLAEKYEGNKMIAGIARETNNVTATDIKTDVRGTTFKLVFDGEKTVRCNTVLLGKHSTSNICLAASVAYKLGMSPQEISKGINRIKSIGHRLELLPNNKNIVIIDDSYNANVEGVKSAMEVLDMFNGRKIVVTPGLVELGAIENVANFEMGKILAKHADMVIIVGKHNAEMLINGLLENGMPRENIRFSKNLNRGNTELNEMMMEGDVVLFENDLPDNYA